MLKPQDLLITLKILSYEDQGRPHNKFKAEDLQGTAWLHHKERLKTTNSPYDRSKDEMIVPDEPDDFEQSDLDAKDEMIVSDEPDDFEQSDLDAIEDFLYLSEPNTNGWTYRKLAKELFLSLSEANQAAKRATAAELLIRRGSRGVRVNRPKLIDFIRYGASVAFFVEEGRIARGIPTAHAAPVFDGTFASSSDYPPVWPCARGTQKGVSITPLYRSATKAVMIDSWLYQQLAIVDIYRIGTAREREEALPFLNEMRGKS